MSVRIGVAGVAGMGMFHLATIPKIDGYVLAAVCDIDQAAVAKATATLPSIVRAFTDLDEMCRSGSIDAVVIVTPNWLHASNVRTALEAGLHVYCEKPMAVTVGECRSIARLARETGRCLQVGFQHRFQHGYATAKRIVASGEIGPLRRADMRATNWFRPNSYFTQRRWRACWQEAGGGVLMLQAIHQLDAFLWMTGIPTRIFARAWRNRPDVEVEDDLYAFLEFQGGARGVLSASTIDPAGTNRIELTGDRGALRVEGDRLRHTRWDDPTSSMLVELTDPFAIVEVRSLDPEPSTDAVTFEECIIACHQDFIDAIRTGGAPLNDAEEATRAVEVSNAVYLSALTGEPVDLPLDAEHYDDAFRRMCAGELCLPAFA